MNWIFNKIGFDKNNCGKTFTGKLKFITPMGLLLF